MSQSILFSDWSRKTLTPSVCEKFTNLLTNLVFWIIFIIRNWPQTVLKIFTKFLLIFTFHSFSLNLMKNLSKPSKSMGNILTSHFIFIHCSLLLLDFHLFLKRMTYFKELFRQYDQFFIIKFFTSCI